MGEPYHPYMSNDPRSGGGSSGLVSTVASPSVLSPRQELTRMWNDRYMPYDSGFHTGEPSNDPSVVLSGTSSLHNQVVFGHDGSSVRSGHSAYSYDFAPNQQPEFESIGGGYEPNVDTSDTFFSGILLNEDLNDVNMEDFKFLPTSFEDPLFNDDDRVGQPTCDPVAEPEPPGFYQQPTRPFSTSSGGHAFDHAAFRQQAHCSYPNPASNQAPPQFDYTFPIRSPLSVTDAVMMEQLSLTPNTLGPRTPTLPPGRLMRQPSAAQPNGDDASLMATALPQIITLLQDEDECVRERAVAFLKDLSSKNKASVGYLEAMAQSAPFCNALLAAVMRPTLSTDVLHNLTTCLYHVSCWDDGVRNLFNANGVRALVTLLSTFNDAVAVCSTVTLHNMLLKCREAKHVIRQNGGVPKMVALLLRPGHTPRFLAVLTDCLRILVLQHAESKLQISQCGGTVELVNIMRMPPALFQQTQKPKDLNNLLRSTLELLKSLSTCSTNKQTIVKNGGMVALSYHLAREDVNLVVRCLWTMRNLSDAATQEQGMEPLLCSLIGILAVPELLPEPHAREIITYVVGILSNLSCNNSDNKNTLCANDGLRVLLKIVDRYRADADIADGALSTLRHITLGHGQALAACAKVQQLNALQMLVSLLDVPPPSSGPQQQSNGGVSWMKLRAALGLIRNLCEHVPNRGELWQYNCVEKMVTLWNIISLDAVQTGFGDKLMYDGVVKPVSIQNQIRAIIGIMKKDDPSLKRLIENSLPADLLTND